MNVRWVRDSIGKRLKTSAAAAGLSAQAMASRLGVSAATVYRWWEGERVPSAEMMERYAEAVGKDAAWMYGSVNDQQVLRDATEVLLNIARMVAEGKRADVAYDEATGAPEELSLRERQELQRADGVLRQFFRDLPDDEDSRRAMLRQVSLLLKANGR